MNTSRLACLLLMLIAAPVIADERDFGRKIAQAAKQKPGKPNKPVTAAVDAKAEAGVLEFVREHHPELADLLTQLKETRPKEYQKAIRDLSRVRDRLHGMKSNDERFALELAVWKAETRVQLIAARLHMGDTSELRDELRTALSDQIDVRLALLKHEREQASERIAKLDAQIKRLDSDRSRVIDQQLQALTKAPPKKQPDKGADKPKDKPASDKPAAKPAAKS
jgi:hypothetical protein